MPRTSEKKPAKLITRSFETHTIRAEGYRLENGVKTVVDVPNLTISTNGMDAAKAVKALMARDNTIMYVVTDISTARKTYAIDEETFLQHAVEVKEG